VRGEGRKGGKVKMGLMLELSSLDTPGAFLWIPQWSKQLKDSAVQIKRSITKNPKKMEFLN